jgi:hypothetical protein
MVGTREKLFQTLHGYLGYYFCLQTVCANRLPPRAVASDYFFVFARATLDALAEAFCDFFTLPLLCATITHTSLTRAFLLTCAQKQLGGDIADLSAQLRALDICIPRITSDTHDACHTAEREAPPDDPALLLVLTRIDQYTEALLRFCEQNIEQSAFRYASPFEKP